MTLSTLPPPPPSLEQSLPFPTQLRQNIRAHLSHIKAERQRGWRGTRRGAGRGGLLFVAARSSTKDLRLLGEAENK